MNSKYLDIFSNWSCKKHGGLFIGAALHFPVTTVTDDIKTEYRSIWITIGLIVLKISFVIKYNHRPYD